MVKFKVNKAKCKRCGHEWVPTKEEIIRCAKCKSPYWNTERKVKKNE